MKLEAVRGPGSGGGVGGRTWEEYSRPSPQSVFHVEAPLPGAFNMFVVKLSGKESQHSSQ